MSSNLITQPYGIILDPTGGGGRAKPVANGKYYVGIIDLDPVANPRTDLAYKDESGTERPLTSPLILNNSGAFVVSENDGTLIQPYMKDGIGHSVLITDKRGTPVYSDIHVGDPGNLTEAIAEYTDIVYKASGGNSAVENMVYGNPITSSIGDVVSTGFMIWKRIFDSSGDLSDFIALNEFNITDFGGDPDGVGDSTYELQQIANSISSFHGLINNGEFSVGNTTFTNKQRIRITGYNGRFKLTGTMSFDTAVSLRLDSVRLEDTTASKSFEGVNLGVSCEGANLERLFIAGLSVGVRNTDNSQNKFINNQYSNNGTHLVLEAVGASTDHQLVALSIFGDADTNAIRADCNNQSFLGNHFETRGSTGYDLTTGGGVTGNAQQTRVQCNTFFDGNGVQMGNSCLIQDNVFNQPRYDTPIIRLDGAQNLVGGNKIFSATTTSGSVAIDARGSALLYANYIRRAEIALNINTVANQVLVSDLVVDSQVGVVGVTTKGVVINNGVQQVYANPKFINLDGQAFEIFGSSDTKILDPTFINVNGGSDPINNTGGSRTFVRAQGTGSPEGAISASPGSEFNRMDGSQGRQKYIKESGGGNTGWRAQGLPQRTSAELLDISNPINTEDKFLATQVYDTTLNRPLYSAGPNASSSWRDSNGSIVHTPS